MIYEVRDGVTRLPFMLEIENDAYSTSAHKQAMEWASDNIGKPAVYDEVYGIYHQISGKTEYPNLGGQWYVSPMTRRRWFFMTYEQAFSFKMRWG